MKKIKLLMPIMSIGVLNTAVLPLFAITSCNCSKKIIVKKLNFSGAKSIFIGSNKNSNEVTKKLFKITENGYIEEIAIIDDHGHTVTQKLQPSWIYPMSDEFMLIYFDAQNDRYLVNKKTGDSYAFNTTYYPDMWCMGYGPTKENFKQDSDGNIFFYARGNAQNPSVIAKLNVTNPNNLSVSIASANGDYPSDGEGCGDIFVADSEGNVVYTGSNSGWLQINRFVTKDKQNLTLNFGGGFWQGYDGNIYTGGYDSINKLVYKRDNQGKIISVDLKKYGSGGGSYIRTKKNKEGTLYLDDQKKIVTVSASGIQELYNGPSSTSTPKHTLAEFNIKTLSLFCNSKKYIYLFGQGVDNKYYISKIDVNDYTFTNTEINGYDIYSMTVDNNELITFNALRSDNAIVVATFDGSIHESSVTFNEKIEYLQHL